MGVHVAQHHKPRLVIGGQPRQFGHGDLIEILRLGTAALAPAAPAGVLDIGIESARAWIAAEADRSRVVALLAHNFGHRLDFGTQRPLMTQRHYLGAEAVHAGQHGSIGWRGRDMRAVGLLEKRRLAGEAVDMRRCQARIAITTHVVSAD